MKTKPNDTAFPGSAELNSGLSKREYFAAQMMGHIVTAKIPESLFNGLPGEIFSAMAAVKFADALIEQLNQESKT